MKEKGIKYKLPSRPQVSKLEQIRKNRKEQLTSVMITKGKISNQLTKIMENQIQIASQLIENSEIIIYLRNLATMNANFMEALAQALVNKGLIEMKGMKKQEPKKEKKEVVKNGQKKNK